MRKVDHTRCRKCKRRLTRTNITPSMLKHRDYLCKKCVNNCKIRRKWRVAANRRRKQLVIDNYGGECACCGESRFEFLTIDHINGGGLAHRRKLGGSGGKIYTWLKQRGFPKRKFQLLCMNCNFAKGHYGQCPHEREK